MAPSEKHFSQSAAARLPKYFRALRNMLLDGVLRTSSANISSKTGANPSQIRQDLALLGSGGQQGYGYNVKQLYTALSRELGTADSFTAIIAGDSPAAEALASSPIFGMRGITPLGYFSAVLPASNGNRAASESAGHSYICPVFPTEELYPFCRENNVDIAVIAMTGSEDPSEVAEKLIECGIKGIWNISQTEILTDRIPVINLIPADSLMTLCHELHINRTNSDNNK